QINGVIFIKFNVTAPPATPLGGGAFPNGNIFYSIRGGVAGRGRGSYANHMLHAVSIPFSFIS
ncbi:MAG: hypothetical protein IKL21_00850, partial [Clostridia bacterium]|nr:hypothetical protein [Clostridia bacterium]